MRRALDRLYDGAAWLAALAMVGLLAMVLASIASRQLGIHIPGTDAYAGYLMAGAGFMALAHTLRRGEHIRVTLLAQSLSPRARRALERASLVMATAMAGLLAFFSARLAWQSRAFNDISTGNDATPLWIPQLGMALGTLIFFVAVVDTLVQHARTGETAVAPAEALRNE